MRIVVLGGAGAMGRVAVRDLVESSQIRTVTVADLDESKAKELVKKLSSKKVTARFADVDNHKQLVELMEGHDVVINCTPYIKNLAVMQAALEAKVHYLDLGGLFHETRKQLKLHDAFKEAELLAILGMGGSPGITNVMARYAVDRLDKVEEIKVRVGSVAMGQSSHPLAVPYSLATLLDEFTKKPVVFTRGEFVEVEPLSGQETTVFPDPLGTTNLVYTLHSEIATFPISFKEKGLREASFKVAFPVKFFERLKFLIDIGLANTEPKVSGTQIAPREFLSKLLAALPQDKKPGESYGVLRVEAIGEKDGRPTRYTLELLRRPRLEWGISDCVAITTGVPPSIVAQMIAREEIKARGVLPPEIAIDPERFFAALAGRGLFVTVTVQQPAFCLASTACDNINK